MTQKITCESVLNERLLANKWRGRGRKLNYSPLGRDGTMLPAFESISIEYREREFIRLRVFHAEEQHRVALRERDRESLKVKYR